MQAPHPGADGLHPELLGSAAMSTTGSVLLPRGRRFSFDGAAPAVAG